MSYCAIVTFKDGKSDDEVIYRNSWGGVALVWTKLFDAYLKNPDVDYDNWMMHLHDESWWGLAERTDLEWFERAVMTATYDRAMVRREHFKQLAEHFRQFVAKYLPEFGCVCHLLDWADFIEVCEAEAIGFYATSVGENLWYRYDEKVDETFPYDLNAEDKHFEVYDWLESLSEKGDAENGGV